MNLENKLHQLKRTNKLIDTQLTRLENEIVEQELRTIVLPLHLNNLLTTRLEIEKYTNLIINNDGFKNKKDLQTVNWIGNTITSLAWRLEQ